MFGIVNAFLLIDDKDEKSHIFEETFLFADISIYIAIRIFCLTLSNL